MYIGRNMGNPDSPFPVELVNFRAEVVDDFVSLIWSTATEINNDYFTVERGKDGTNWTEIGRVQGNGNSSERIEYSFSDRMPLSNASYYRLIQTDFDGTTEELGIRNVFFGWSENLIKVFPNPVHSTQL